MPNDLQPLECLSTVYTVQYEVRTHCIIVLIYVTDFLASYFLMGKQIKSVILSQGMQLLLVRGPFHSDQNLLDSY